MSTPEGDPISSGEQQTEEELRAAYEAEIKKVRVEQVLLELVVTLVNLGMRKTGLAPGTESERDLEQVGLAIESVRAQLPQVERSSPQQAGPIRDALSQLQLAFVKIGGQEAAPGPGRGSTPGGEPPPDQERRSESGQAGQPSSEPAKSGEPGPAQRSGRLWIPGQ